LHIINTGAVLETIENALRADQARLITGQRAARPPGGVEATDDRCASRSLLMDGPT
jgi:hypothetical protein